MGSGESSAVEHGWMQAGRWHRLVETVNAALRAVHIQRKEKVLRVRETAALGERRFLALVEWKGQQLLLGVTPGAITLLKTQTEEPGEATKKGNED